MKYPAMVKWMIKEKRWSKTGKRFETKVLNTEELDRMMDFLKSDTKISLLYIESINDATTQQEEK